MNVIGYKIYFWSNENDEPIHVHISKGKLTQNSTKIWLTKAGGCIVANNKSKISEHELNKLLSIISKHYFLIISKWKEYYRIININEIKFYC
ncbi:MAG: DUF4160 domain-containing protein [Clostridia bacterium]